MSEIDGNTQRSRPGSLITERLRHVLFSEAGAVAAWMLLGFTALGAWGKLIRPQNEVTQTAMFVLGGWWLAGVVVAQCLIPQGTDEDRVVEGFAAGGWQGMLAICFTGLVVWDAYFVNVEYVNPGLRGGTTALSAWLLGTFLAGMLVIWLRGHRLWRGDVRGDRHGGRQRLDGARPDARDAVTSGV